MDLTDRPADAAAPHQLPPQERAGDDLLARALRRARWTIFWERLWPALASIATVIGLFLAVAGRPRHRPRHLLPAHGGCVRAAVDAARAEPDGRSATARSQFRPAAPAGHRDRGRDCSLDRRFLFGGAVACPYRTRPARCQDAQGRYSRAATRAARPLRSARVGGGTGGRDVLRCRR